MKRFICLITSVIIFFSSLSQQVLAEVKKNYEQIIGSHLVVGTILKDKNGFSKGETVEVLQGEKQKVFLVKSLSTGKTSWIDRSSINIAPDKNENIPELDKEIIEEYVNYKNFKSPTKYLIWVDLLRQKTYVLLKGENGYRLHKIMPCATGINMAPTPKGVFQISSRGNWFYSDYYKQGGKYWVRFNGSYLFHSLPMDKQGRVVDYTIGKKASHGCVRLKVEDAYWLYKNVPNKTLVYIN